MQPESCIPLQPCGFKKRPSREVPNPKSDWERDCPMVETQDNFLGKIFCMGAVVLQYSKGFLSLLRNTHW
jgi:hypothetical protein